MISGLGLALDGAAPSGVACTLAVAQSADGDHVQRTACVSVAAVVEAVPVGASGGHRDRAGAAERGERRAKGEPAKERVTA